MREPPLHRDGGGENGRLYRRLWRWHFYAAFLVIPFVLMQSITGTLYLWHDEWADWAHPELRFVEPASGAASFDAQVAAASAAHADARATTLMVSDDPRRATQVMFGGHHDGGDALPFPVFVDPYSGRVLGDLPGWSWMPGWSRKIHGGWPLGDAGSWLLELGACWAVVMILTGLYLWWPRNRGWVASLVPRTGQGARILVRDLHGSVAVLFSAIILAFLVTALPWTKFWGEQILKPIQNATGQASPFGAASRAKSAPLNGVQPISLDEAVKLARAAGLRGDLEVKLDGQPDSGLSLRNRMPRASQEIAIAFDRGSRQPLVTTTWADYPTVPRAVATGVDLHEGSFFGRANRWFNTLVSLALVWMSATGFLSWWLRRPKGRLAAPLRADVRLPQWALATGIGLCALMPLLGASVLLLWMADLLIVRLRQAPITGRAC
ncbi:MAG: PepSY-associated TM helix domain-containing protein [Panacagrimonas sp.]